MIGFEGVQMSYETKLLFANDHINGDNPSTLLKDSKFILGRFWPSDFTMDNFKLLQIRNIDENLQEEGFLNYCQNYGHVTRYIWLPTKREFKPKGRVLKVHVSDVKLRVTARSIQRIFETYGKVELVAITGPKPFDKKHEVLQFLVQYSKSEEAFQAFNKLDGKYIFFQKLGCRLDIDLTDLNDLHVCWKAGKSQTVKQQPQQEEIINAGDAEAGSAVIIVKNLHYINPSFKTTVTPEMVYNIFSLYGHVVKIKFFATQQMRDNRQVSILNGLVEMESHMQARRAAHFLNKFFLFRHWSQSIISDKKHSIKPDSRHASDRLFRLLDCQPGASRNVEYNIYHRPNFNYLDFRPTPVIRVSSLSPNVTTEAIHRLMSDHYGQVKALKHQGTSCDILFLGLSGATTAIACVHGMNWEGSRLSATFLPETCIPKPKTHEDRLAFVSWPPPQG